jgi:HSP20 family molecular chaperone IbpA
MKKKQNLQTKFQKIISNIKNYNYSKSFIATLFLVIGVGSTLTFQTFAYNIKDNNNFRELSQTQQFQIMKIWMEEMNHFMNHYERKELLKYNRFFNDSYYQNPLSEIRRIRSKIHQDLTKFDNLFENNHRKFHKKINNNQITISQKEDDGYLYFYLKSKDIAKNNIKINVEDNILIFASEVKDESLIKEDNFRKESFSSSNFNYSFSLPKDINKKPIIKKEKDKIIVKFKKN